MTDRTILTSSPLSIFLNPTTDRQTLAAFSGKLFGKIYVRCDFSSKVAEFSEQGRQSPPGGYAAPRFDCLFIRFTHFYSASQTRFFHFHTLRFPPSSKIGTFTGEILETSYFSLSAFFDILNFLLSRKRRANALLFRDVMISQLFLLFLFLSSSVFLSSLPPHYIPTSSSLYITSLPGSGGGKGSNGRSCSSTGSRQPH